ATVNQTRADLYLRLLDGTLDGQTRPQILTTMLHLGPLTPTDDNPDTGAGPEPRAESSQHHDPGERDHEPPQPAPPAPPEQPEQPEQPVTAEQSDCAQQPTTSAPTQTGTPRPVRYGIEVRVRLSTLLGIDDHPAELPGWGPIPAAAARDLVATQHHTEWRIAIVDTDGYLLHGDLTRRRPNPPHTHRDRAGGIVEIALPVTMLDQLPTLATQHPGWARVLHGITSSWHHRDHARAALDQHPNRRFAHTALRRHIQIRDRNCIGPGCRRRAATADLDHTHDHAHGGPTITTNTGPTCPHDHTKKHQGGWTPTQPQASHFTWTSPLGQTYHTRGEPIIPDLPPPLPRPTDPPGTPITWDGPTFSPPPPPPPPTRPPPTELPDQPPF
ncbi:MAG: HNH endonuclease signature motif containing protein, partial [Pseudonocardiaceae bacterium]